MSANQASFPIAAMARVLGVSKAGYYAWLQRPPSAHATADAALLKRVRPSMPVRARPGHPASCRSVGGSNRKRRPLDARGRAGRRQPSARCDHNPADKDARPPDHHRDFSAADQTSRGSPISPMQRQVYLPSCSTPEPQDRRLVDGEPRTELVLDAMAMAIGASAEGRHPPQRSGQPIYVSGIRQAVR